jgi:hypothetical protein
MTAQGRFIAAIALLFMAATTAFAQARSNTGRDISVEESYLQESVENMIIREQSRAESRDMKLVALEYIHDAIDRGNTGRDVQQALEYLGTEGVVNQTRENGRLVNNYPDVRTKAAEYLGDMGTPEAQQTLLKMCLADNEPMVLTEVVKSLAKIGNNDDGLTAEAIAWVVTRFDVLNPDNLLALSALEAFEKLAAANNGLTDVNAVRTVIRIAEGPYIKPVQNRAKQLLLDLRSYNQNNGQQQKQNSQQQSGM